MEPEDFQTFVDGLFMTIDNMLRPYHYNYNDLEIRHYYNIVQFSPYSLPFIEYYTIRFSAPAHVREIIRLINKKIPNKIPVQEDETITSSIMTFIVNQRDEKKENK